MDRIYSKIAEYCKQNNKYTNLEKSMKIFYWLKTHILLIALILLFGYFFFYRLDYNTLASWDEGWYASIARDIVKTGDFMHMMWNGQPYYDHPPMGFWLMAISYKLFGINEFSTRLPSAILGLFSIVLIYKTGIELYGKKIIGFVASLVLGTSVWYLIRVRSGNLESVFVFFYLLTIFLSLKSSKNFKWFPFMMVSFGALILSKTLVGVSALIPIVIINIIQLLRVKNLLFLIIGSILFMLVVMPWYSVQMKSYPDFIQHHFFTVGMRDKTTASYFQLMIEKPFFYIHMGVRKWYYLWLLATGYLILSFKFLKKHIFFLLLWNTVILYPFLTSEKTELWHLIPVYLPVALIISVGIYEGLLNCKQLVMKFSPHTRRFAFLRYEGLYSFVYLFFFFIIAVMQIRIFLPEVFPQTRYVPDDVAISQKAGSYDKTFYLDDDFVPIAVYYSGKIVNPLAYQPDNRKNLVKLFNSSENNFIVVTRNWALNNLNEAKIPYKILEQNNSFTITSRP